MNELEKQLSVILEKAINVAEQTGEFAIEQAPLLLQEFYQWHIASAIFGIITSLVITLLIHLIIRYFVRLEDDESIYTFEIFQSIPLIILITNIYDLIFVLVAPKLYLIDYFIK